MKIVVYLYFFIVKLFFINHTLAVTKEIQTKGILSFLFGNKKTCYCKCGIPNRQERILGGEYTKSYEFPWLALVNVHDSINIGGVLINDKYILTAAEPVAGTSPYELKVTLGVYDRCHADVSSSNVSVEAVITHPDFNIGLGTHDIALLRLSHVVPFEKRINPICLPNLDSKYLGQVATVVGWSQGLSPEDLPLSTCRPRKVGLPVLGKECDNTVLHSATPHLPYHQGCIGIVGALSVICETDVGTAVQFRTHAGFYEVIGVLAAINECSAVPNTALYTRVNSHIEWILHNTLDACYCSRPFYLY